MADASSVAVPQASTDLVLIVDGARREFPSANFIIGTADSCAVRLRKGRCEPRHAQVWQARSGQWWVRGIPPAQVIVNGVVHEKHRLVPGQVLTLGEARVEIGRPADREAKTLIAPPSSITLDGGSRDAPALSPGLVVSKRYKVVERIAGGGMGDVFRVEHLELGKTFAMKVLKPEFSADDDFVNRFKREAFAASRLGHENIVELTDSGRTPGGQNYFVMEDLRGVTLLKALVDAGRFTAKRAAHVGLQVASALEAAHGEGVIHRDLKPANVMLLQRPRRPDFVKVLDFGAAKVLTGSGALAQTAVGMVVGTPEYMSPEHAGGLPVDARSDLYSLGLVLYELLTGRRPFGGPTPTAVLVQQLSKPPPPFDPALRVPDALSALVMRLLAKKVFERPESAGEVIEQLEPFAK